MKKVLILTLAALLAASQARAQESPPPAPAAPGVHVGVPKFMPDDIAGRELKDLTGRAFRLSDFGGRVYVLNL